MKKLFFMCLAAPIVWLDTAVRANAQETSGTCGPTLNWALSGSGDNRTLTISGTGAMTDWSNTSARPWHYYRNSITSVVIGSGVTTIGNLAFASCSVLSSVTIPSSVTTIASNAFQTCANLASVINHATTPPPYTVSNSGTDLYVPAAALALYQAATGWSAFRNIVAIGSSPYPKTFNCGSPNAADVTATIAANGALTISGIGATHPVAPPWGSYGNVITQAVINSGVTTIGGAAFQMCANLVSVTIPNSVTNFADAGALYARSALTSINVAADNGNYSSVDGVLFNKNKTILIHPR